MGTELGQIVGDERTRRGVGQSALARRTGIPQSAISRIEAGEEVPSLERFGRLVAGLGLRPDIELAPIASHRGERAHLAGIRDLTPGERIEQAAGWGELAAQVRGKAARA
ncbi:MAG: helix-turn-helix domain protein [Geminicoccaceae bacterium]|jgi:transcriptional regulator with XRE-family HTH domain|nr:helix-turn-helix domain protein [Geminicoccaceae bacterium]